VNRYAIIVFWSEDDRAPRLRLLPDDDLHVLIERCQERHQPLHREAVEPVIRQRGHLIDA
jgi:hypothetical protein